MKEVGQTSGPDDLPLHLLQEAVVALTAFRGGGVPGIPLVSARLASRRTSLCVGGFARLSQDQVVSDIPLL